MNNINTNIRTLEGKDITENSEDEMYRLYRLKWHGYPKNNIIPAFPLFLDIEATSACNLSCPHCIQTIQNQKKGFMTWDIYEKIIDEASANGCYGCKYHTIGRGEPLLHRDIVKMVQYAKKKGLIDVYINTNATLLNDRLTEKLLDTGLDRISFSIDGYNEEQYKMTRRGASFTDILLNVKYFMARRDLQKYNTKIRIQTVELEGIDLYWYKEFWKDYADEVAVIKYKDMEQRKFGLVSDWKCSQLWQRASILFDGKILPCNHDDRQLAVFGNIKNDTISKIWRSKELQFMREEHLDGKADLIPACDGCFLRSSIIGK